MTEKGKRKRERERWTIASRTWEQAVTNKQLPVARAAITHKTKAMAHSLVPVRSPSLRHAQSILPQAKCLGQGQEDNSIHTLTIRTILGSSRNLPYIYHNKYTIHAGNMQEMRDVYAPFGYKPKTRRKRVGPSRDHSVRSMTGAGLAALGLEVDALSARLCCFFRMRLNASTTGSCEGSWARRDIASLTLKNACNVSSWQGYGQV